ncbi:cytochrome P450 [Streptomyces sp. NPDC090127]|uniref:cytochrome P450 n=1 Tax=Streptomyces sp. NPDC090127 TaxID=3365953 RepID=UPI00382C198A
MRAARERGGAGTGLGAPPDVRAGGVAALRGTLRRAPATAVRRRPVAPLGRAVPGGGTGPSRPTDAVVALRRALVAAGRRKLGALLGRAVPGGRTGPSGPVDTVAALRRARRRDRRVYSRAHPLLFALLAAVRRRPVARLGRAVVVNGADPYREALTRVPLDRAAAGTTGGAARELSGGRTLFDQEGADHRDTRRAVAGDLGAAGVERLRPVWRAVLDRELAPLAAGHGVDLVPLARALAGATVRALLDSPAEASALVEAAADAASAAVRDHLPGPRPPGTARAAARATARLEALLGHGETPAVSGGGSACPHRDARRPPVTAPGTTPPRPDAYDPKKHGPEEHGPEEHGPEEHGPMEHGPEEHGPMEHGPEEHGPRPRPTGTPDAHEDAGLRAMIAVAAVNTTVAALPRAVAWCADGGLWEQAADERLRAALVGELLRVTAPSPLLPRVAAADAVLGGRPVRAGDRLLLVARHAVGAHVDPPDAHRPAPPAVSRLVFGAGPHACPGARLALAQLDDVLAALAPYRPAVVSARVDRRAALPGWRRLTVRPTTTAAHPRPHPPTERPS